MHDVMESQQNVEAHLLCLLTKYGIFQRNWQRQKYFGL